MRRYEWETKNIKKNKKQKTKNQNIVHSFWLMVKYDHIFIFHLYNSLYITYWVWGYDWWWHETAVPHQCRKMCIDLSSQIKNFSCWNQSTINPNYYLMPAANNTHRLSKHTYWTQPNIKLTTQNSKWYSENLSYLTWQTFSFFGLFHFTFHCSVCTHFTSC